MVGPGFLREGRPHPKGQGPKRGPVGAAREPHARRPGDLFKRVKSGNLQSRYSHCQEAKPSNFSSVTFGSV